MQREILSQRTEPQNKMTFISELIFIFHSRHRWYNLAFCHAIKFIELHQLDSYIQWPTRNVGDLMTFRLIWDAPFPRFTFCISRAYVFVSIQYYTIVIHSYPIWVFWAFPKTWPHQSGMSSRCCRDLTFMTFWSQADSYRSRVKGIDTCVWMSAEVVLIHDPRMSAKWYRIDRRNVKTTRRKLVFVFPGKRQTFYGSIISEISNS